jgi:hypothetical protein
MLLLLIDAESMDVEEEEPDLEPIDDLNLCLNKLDCRPILLSGKNGNELN